MKVKDEYLLHQVEDLRNILGEPLPKLSMKVSSKIDEYCQSFIEKSPLVFLATSDEQNNLDVSPKGDAPGFIKVMDESTILIPDRIGNRLAYGFKNILQTGKAGLIFIIPTIKETFRVNGHASISRDPELLEMLSAQGKPALLCTIIKVEECFFHCGKALVRSKLWKPDSWPKNAKSGAAKQLSEKLVMDENAIEKNLVGSYARCKV